MSRNPFIAKKIAVAEKEGTLPKSTHASSVVGVTYNARMITPSKDILQSAAPVHDIEQEGRFRPRNDDFPGNRSG